MRMYEELAEWYHLLTPPSEYDEEAAFFVRAFTDALGEAPRTLLELGSGGGCMAWHYKRQVTATLTDLSPRMLAISRSINPECEHVEGDMRTLRLGRVFDAILVHDAVMYLLTEEDLRQAMVTAYAHLRPGGVAVFAPDYTRETFQPRTGHGGHDGEGRALRYLEWTTDPDPSDSTYVVDYAYLLHEDGRPMRVEHDRHIEGLFGREVWPRLLAEAGFEVEVRGRELDEPGFEDGEVFVARRLVGGTNWTG
ncbi:MAG: class I SAM-dependent methyltransferase [Chloroflexi bacterium]|nr:class I SAM-dependent methyltransferase [Chloroflexota bacterium]